MAQGKLPRHGDSLGMVGRSCPRGRRVGQELARGAGGGSGQGLRRRVGNPGRPRPVPAGCCQETGTHSPARPAPASSLPAPGEWGWGGNPGTVTLPVRPGAPGLWARRWHRAPAAPGCSSGADVLALRENNPLPPSPAGTAAPEAAGPGQAGPGRAGLGCVGLSTFTQPWTSTPGPAHLCSGTDLSHPLQCAAVGEPRVVPALPGPTGEPPWGFLTHPKGFETFSTFFPPLCSPAPQGFQDPGAGPC